MVNKSGRNIKLTKEKLDRNKAFMEAIYCAELEKVNKWFDQLPPASAARQDDSDMTLDLFLSKFSLHTAVTLDIGIPMLPDEIRYCASGKILDDGITRFAWLTCILNESNYLKIDSIFTKIYDCDLVAIKYSQGMSELGIKIQTPRAPGCLTVVQLNGYDVINPKTMLELVKAYFTDRFKIEEVHYMPIPECRINEMTANGFLYKGPKIGSLSERDTPRNVLFAVYSWENPDPRDTRSSEHNAHKLQLFSPFQQSLETDKMSEALMNFQMQMRRIKQ